MTLRIEEIKNLSKIFYQSNPQLFKFESFFFHACFAVADFMKQIDLLRKPIYPKTAKIKEEKIRKRTCARSLLMTTITVVFSGNVNSAEQGEGERQVPCTSFSMAIRESFKKIPARILSEIRPLYVENRKTFASLSSRPRDAETLISVYRCGLERSSAYGKIVGFEYKKPGRNTDYVQFRLDWDERKGGHINLQIGKGDRSEKYAFTIKRTNGTPITSEKDFQCLTRRIDKSDRNARDVVSILMGLGNIRNPAAGIEESPAQRYLVEEKERQEQNNRTQTPDEQSGQWAEENAQE